MKTLLLVLALVAGCHVMPAPEGALEADGLPRLYQFAPGMFRGPQPTRDQFAALARIHGIVTDVKLNTALPFDGGHDALADGMDIYHHPWAPLGPVTHEQVVELMADLETAPRPLYIHCLHGEDRTGLAVGLYRVRHGAFPAAAFGEMRAFGFHDGDINTPGLPLLVESFERETNWKVNP